MPEKAISSTAESLKWIYGVIIALSIGEAFTQVVLSPGSTLPGIQWDRLPSLCSVILLVVPFYHGMSRYFCEMYDIERIGPRYGLWLLLDCLVFTVEAAFFFILARSLPKGHWADFTLTVLALLFWDVLWGVFVWKYRTSAISSWVIVNLCTIPLLGAVLLSFRGSTSWWAVSLVSFVILVRVGADYATGWPFYFPTSQKDAIQQSTRS
jgi:hypothetical protein